MTTPILTTPDPRLRRRAEPIRSISRQVRDRVGIMLEAMRAHRGVGLAAPQIGWNARVIVVGAPEELILVNPHSLILYGADVEEEEACLSVPGLSLWVVRSEKCRLKATGLDGKEKDIQADGLFARIIQHEMDHLEGRLVIDHGSEVRR